MILKKCAKIHFNSSHHTSAILHKQETRTHVPAYAVIDNIQHRMPNLYISNAVI